MPCQPGIDEAPRSVVARSQLVLLSPVEVATDSFDEELLVIGDGPGPVVSGGVGSTGGRWIRARKTQ